jgi:predicted dienelactone hydrolase
VHDPLLNTVGAMDRQPIRNRRLTRRRLLTTGVSLAGSTTLAAAGIGTVRPTVASAARTSPPPAVPRLSLPAPTGRRLVGTTSLHLVDDSRTDPLAPSPRKRELMVRLWYPASHSHQPAAAYLTPGVASAYVEFLRTTTGADLPGDLLSFSTHSAQDAPAARGPRRPVALFSHGFGVSAAVNTGLHEELASRGYVVAGIDHTFDAGAVEFPDGRVEAQQAGLPIDDLLRQVRVADVRFTLDSLTALAAGRNPDAGHRDLPRGLSQALDLTRVAGYGHSLGCPAVVGAMGEDRRIDVTAALDGDLVPAPHERPVLIVGNQHRRHAADPELAAFYDQLRGPRLYLVIDGAEHSDITDFTVFKSTVDLSAVFNVGPINGVRALGIQRAYLAAWFDRALRGRHSRLLRGESPRFPEVDFQP